MEGPDQATSCHSVLTNVSHPVLILKFILSHHTSLESRFKKEKKQMLFQYRLASIVIMNMCYNLKFQLNLNLGNPPSLVYGNLQLLSNRLDERL